MEEILKSQSKLPPQQSILLSFFSVYFFFYIFPFPLGYNGNFDSISNAYNKGFTTIILWLNRIFFHHPIMTAVDNGSGDRAFNYVQVFTMAVLALIAIGIWHLFAKKKHATQILYWLYMYVQLYLSVTLVRYGLIKAIKAQFPFPYNGLTETYAESSPLQLMINFMGYSTVYNAFTGTIEVLAGVLIIFRKTSLIGALIAVAAMGNVVMMNIAYDVPVKLHAIHLLLMAMFIAAPFAGRLRSLFISNAATYIQAPRLIFEYKRNSLIAGGMILLSTLLLYSNLQRTRLKYSVYGDGAFQNTPLFGIYKINRFVKNRDTLLPLITDTLQWKTLTIVYKKRATIKMMNDSTKLCRIVTDTSKGILTLTDQEDTTYLGDFFYQQPDAMHLVLNGKIKKDSVVIWLEKQDLKKFRLVNHEFHWIHESLDTR